MPIIEQVETWLNRHKGWLGFLLLVALLAFPYELFNFTLSIDEELHAELDVRDMDAPPWVLQSRWGMHLLSHLFPPNPVIPFSPLFMALIFSALGYSLVTRIFSTERTRADYLAAPLFIACPVLYYVYSFSTLCHGIGVGLFVTALGLYVFVNGSGRSRFLAIPLFSFAISIYQVFASWAVVLFCFYVLGQILKNDQAAVKQLLNLTGQFVLILIVSVAGYYLVAQLFLAYYQVETNEYIGYYIKLKWTGDYWAYALKRTAGEMRNLYLGGAEVYMFQVLSLPVLLVSSGVAVLVLIAKSGRSCGLKVIGVTALLGALLTPFVFHLVNAGHMPNRTMIGIPLVISGLLWFAWLIPGKAMRVSLTVLAVVCSFSFLAINNRMAFASHLSWQADRDLAVRILSRLDDVHSTLPAREPGQQWPVEVVGYPPLPPKPFIQRYETIGASFFSWEGGTARRVVPFLQTMGHNEFRLASFEEEQSVMMKADGMPVWPNKGSIAVINGIIVIKMNHYGRNQKKRLCLPDRRINIVCQIQNPWERPDVRIIPREQAEVQLRSLKPAYQLNPMKLDVALVHLKKVSATPEVLRLEVSNEKPKIILPQVPFSDQDSVLLNLTLKSDKASEMGFHLNYYKNPDIRGKYKWHYSLVFVDKGVHRLSFLIPGKLLHYSMRIDPASDMGNFEIQQMEMFKISTQAG